MKNTFKKPKTRIDKNVKDLDQKLPKPLNSGEEKTSAKNAPTGNMSTSLFLSLHGGYLKGPIALLETLITIAESQSEQWESKKFWICLAVGRDWHPFHSDVNPPYGSGGGGWGGLWTLKVKTWKHSWKLTKSVNDCESWLPLDQTPDIIHIFLIICPRWPAGLSRIRKQGGVIGGLWMITST